MEFDRDKHFEIRLNGEIGTVLGISSQEPVISKTD